MSTALYRRYRPESFADVIGQEHVTEPLMQALRTGRVNHAYLFSGPRGCGKTTSARILARCLNCEQGPTPEPCGTCDSCVALARAGAGSIDVIEIDAASHGGVDDARDLRERASYGPAQSRYKIYIIDEAHMVTPQGFNALLKIVEEPPEHVKFVFATTEPDKVISTIRSRTHHYPFRLVPPARLQAYLEKLCEAEGVPVAPGVLSFVVRAGGGSVRDSLSVLDQLMAGSGDAGLTYEGAAALLGFTDAELLDATIEALAAGDAAGVFGEINRVIETGIDPRRFVEDLLERLRDLIVVAAVPDGASSVLRGLPEDQIERMRQQAAAFGPGSLSRAADIVNAGLTEMTGATAPRLQLELIGARVLLPGAAGESGYAARLDRLERRLDVEGVPSAAAPRQPAQRQAPAPEEPQQPAVLQPPQPAVQQPPQQPHEQEVVEQPARPAAESTAPPFERSWRRGPDAGEALSDQPAAPESRDPVDVAVGAGATGATARPGGGIDTAAIRRSWPDVLAKIFALKRSTWTFLSEHAQVLDYDGDRLLLGISTVGLANTFRRGQHAELVRQALIDVLGVDARVEGVPTPEAKASAAAPPVPAKIPQSGSRQSPPAASAAEDGPDSGSRRPVSPDSGIAAGHEPPIGGGAPDQPRSGYRNSPDGPSAVDGPGFAAGGPAAQSSPDARGTQVSSSGAVATRHTPESGGDWASVPAPAGSGPSWANEAPPAPAPASQTATEDVAGASVEPKGSRLRRAMAVVAAERPATSTAPQIADDSAASADDEDIEEAGEVGRPVVERLLGGQVINEGP